MKTLRIVCCILACACVLAAIPLGILLGVIYAVASLLAAILFGAGMYFFKNKSEPRTPSTDFMNTDEENAAIRAEQDAHKDND